MIAEYWGWARTALAALVASSLAAPVVMKALITAKSQQNVSAHLQEHAHKQGTPTMGGIIVLIGVLTGILIGFPGLNSLPLLVLIVGFGVIGFVDDFVVPRRVKGSRGLGWKEKLAMQILTAAGAFLLAGARDPLTIVVEVFVILFFSNAYNFADGLDALAGGIGAMMAIGFVGIELIHAVTLNIPSSWAPHFLLALAVSFIPFLYYNAPPARVFMGDVGALPIGALLGYAFVGNSFFIVGRSLAIAPMVLPALLVSFLMFVELVPVPLQIASVKLRKKRMFPFKTPVHHAFQEAGWPETRIVWVFHLVQAVCVIAAWSLALYQSSRPA